MLADAAPMCRRREAVAAVQRVQRQLARRGRRGRRQAAAQRLSCVALCGAARRGAARRGAGTKEMHKTPTPSARENFQRRGGRRVSQRLSRILMFNVLQILVEGELGTPRLPLSSPLRPAVWLHVL